MCKCIVYEYGRGNLITIPCPDCYRIIFDKKLPKKDRAVIGGMKDHQCCAAFVILFDKVRQTCEICENHKCHPHILFGLKNRDMPRKWSLPGGKLEDGETVAEAAVREVKEEFKLELEIDSLRKYSPIAIKDAKCKKYVIVFFCETDTEEQSVRLRDLIKEASADDTLPFHEREMIVCKPIMPPCDRRSNTKQFQFYSRLIIQFSLFVCEITAKTEQLPRLTGLPPK